MRLHPSSLLLMSLLSPPLWAACDCTKFPFRPEPPCETQCYALLANAASDERLSNLGFSSELIAKIGIAKQKSQRELTWDAYKKQLSRADFARMKGVFDSITVEKWAAAEAMDHQKTLEASVDTEALENKTASDTPDREKKEKELEARKRLENERMENDRLLTPR